MIGLNLSDIGLTSDAPVKDAKSKPAKHGAGNSNAFSAPKCGQDSVIVDQSVFAKALYHGWAGTPCVILDSPPGAGKTTTVVDLSGMLAKRAGLKVLVLVPTNRAGNDVGARINMRWGADAAKPGSGGLNPQSYLPRPLDEEGEEIAYGEHHEVTIRTVASAAMTGLSRDNFDIVIVDEAYQSTYASVVRALTSSRELKDVDENGEETIEHVDTSIEQVIFIGDPEQIGPVVLDRDSPLLADGRVNVSVSAPEAFAQIPGTVRLSLPSTYRLGEETTKIVNRFYEFDFDSRRPDMRVEGLEELNTLPVEMDSRTDPAIARLIAAEVEETLGSDFTYVDLYGQEKSRPVEGADVAVVAAHNDQVSLLRSTLKAVNPTIVVGTADSLQGGQWPVVFALDPLSGVAEPSDHHFSLGRLCVMLSRHMSSLVWVYEKSWKSKVSEYVEEDEEAAMHRSVRKALISGSMEM